MLPLFFAPLILSVCFLYFVVGSSVMLCILASEIEVLVCSVVVPLPSALSSLPSQFVSLSQLVSVFHPSENLLDRAEYKQKQLARS